MEFQEASKIGSKDYFYMAFGFIVGVGWIVATGSWVEDAGPIGAIVAFFIGAAFLLPVGLCYAELGGQYPVNGGIVFYAYKAFGRDVAYFMAVFFLISFVTALIFFTIVAAWLFEALLPELAGPALYSFFGSQVSLGGVICAAALTIILGVTTYLGAATSTKIQELVMLAMLLGAAVLVGAAVFWGSPQNLKPMINNSDKSSFQAIGAVVVTTPFFLAGFEAIAQSFGEKKASVTAQKIAWIIVAAILSACVFYGIVILSGAYLVDRETLVNAPLPMEAAFREGTGSTVLGKFLLLVGLFGLITSWNACLFATARVFDVLGKLIFHWRGFSPKSGKSVSLHAVMIPSVIGMLGVLGGRGAFDLVLNASALAIGLIYFGACACLLSLRSKIEPHNRLFRGQIGKWYPIVACLVSGLLAIYIVYEPTTWSEHFIPLEWVIFVSVLLLCVAHWLVARRGWRKIDSNELESSLSKI